MRRSILLGAVALLAAVACNKEAQKAPVAAPEFRQVTVDAQKAPETKVMYGNDTEFMWGKIETIGIYVYSGESTLGSIDPFYLEEGAGTNHGKFTASLASGSDYGYVALYPYSEGQNVWVGQQEEFLKSRFDPAEGVLTFFLPPYYTNQGAGYDEMYSARMPMAAKLDMSGDKGTIEFKNVGGLVKVTLTDLPSDARYFKLWSSNGKNLSGRFTIKVDDIGTEYLASEGDVPTVELSLAENTPCSETMELYFPVPCGTFVFGIGIYSDNGIILEKDGTTQNTINRGTILQMPAVSMNDQPVNPTDPGDAGYFLIGEFGTYNWNHDVVLQHVATEGFTNWYAAKNISASSNGKIAFKFRSSTDWNTCSQFGAAMAYDKQLNVLFNLEANSGLNHDIVLQGTGTYDIYFSPEEEKCFILTAGSAYAVPTTVETKPETPAGTSDWSVIGVVNGSNWNTDYSLKTKDGSKWHYLTDVNIQGEFKFRKDKSWGENLGASGSSVLTLTLGTPATLAQDGKNLKAPSTGSYDVYLDPQGKQVVLVSAGGAAPAE